MGDRRLVTDKGSFSGPYEHLAVVTQHQWEEAQGLLYKQMRIKDPQEKPVKLDFLLQGLVFCKVCEAALKTKVIKGNEGFYYCPQHKQSSLAKERIENEVMTKAKEFFTNLLRSESIKLFERYKARSRENLEILIKRQESLLNKANTKLMNQTEQWLKTYSEPGKKEIQDKICSSYDYIVNADNERQSITAELQELEENFQRSTTLLSDTLFSDQVENYTDETTRSLLLDIIHKIWINQYFLHIEFKHPFLSVKEAIVL
jgi:hypothetical protein